MNRYNVTLITAVEYHGLGIEATDPGDAARRLREAIEAGLGADTGVTYVEHNLGVTDVRIHKLDAVEGDRERAHRDLSTTERYIETPKGGETT